jgi:hypothetical protein
MGVTIELFFQIFNTILIIAIPVCIYTVIKKLALNRKSIEERITNIENKLNK